MTIDPAPLTRLITIAPRPKAERYERRTQPPTRNHLSLQGVTAVTPSTIESNYTCSMDATTTSKLYAVLKRMRELTDAGVPFDIEFYSYSTTSGESSGLKKATNVVLRTGMSRAYSDKADILIGYKKDGNNRWFNLPLLIKFNNKFIYEH